MRSWLRRNTEAAYDAVPTSASSAVLSSPTGPVAAITPKWSPTRPPSSSPTSMPRLSRAAPVSPGSPATAHPSGRSLSGGPPYGAAALLHSTFVASRQGGGAAPTSCSGRCSYASIAPSAAVIADPANNLVYDVDMSQLPLDLQRAFARLHFDDAAQLFLKSCRPSCVLSVVARVLTCFLSVTDTNGLLGRGQMHVLSEAQVRMLLPDVARSSRDGCLLDVGAGDGNVTAKFAPLFGTVVTTEVSAPMCRRLRQRGYTCFQTASIGPSVLPKSGCYDVVSILNVLDRCDHPARLLRDARRLLKPDTGRLVLAVVLPFSAFVERGSRRAAPAEPLDMAGARCGDGAPFEASLTAMCQRVLVPMGFVIETVSRVPYLCRGDMSHPFYVLYDAVLVCRVPAGAASPSPDRPASLWDAAVPGVASPGAKAGPDAV